MKRWLFYGALVTLVLTAGSVWAKDWSKVRIGVEGAYPPFSYTTPSGELAGFDIDIAKALGEAMGAEVTLIAQQSIVIHNDPAEFFATFKIKFIIEFAFRLDDFQSQAVEVVEVMIQ